MKTLGELTIAYLKSHMEVRQHPSKPTEFSICCPFCPTRYKKGSVDTNFKLGINSEKALFHCWRCTSGGDLVTFLADYTQTTRTAILESFKSGFQVQRAPLWIDVMLAEERERDPVTAQSTWSRPITVEEVTRIGHRWLTFQAMPEAFVHASVKYCEYRKFDFWKLTNEYGMRLAWRQAPRGSTTSMGDAWLAFPDFNPEGEVIYMVYRYVGDPPPKTPKTLNPAVPRRKVLWGFWRAHHFSDIVLCEGVLDALRVGHNAVALLSKQISEDQVRLLAAHGVERTTLLLDDDVPDHIIEKNAAALRQIAPMRIAKCPPGKDPGDLTEAEVQAVLQAAVPYRPGRDNRFMTVCLKD